MGPGRHRLIHMLLKLQEQNGLRPLVFVPVGISYESQPRSSKWGVKVWIGKPLSTPETDQAPVFTENIMQEIARLCLGPEKLLETPPEPTLRDLSGR